MRSIYFIFIFLSAFEMAMAANAVKAPELTYSEIARTRRYAAGADESDLKVQSTLYQTVSTKKKKKNTTTEPVEGF